MVQTARILAIAALLLLTAGGAVGAEEQQLTFKGEFVWSARDKGGELEAVFTPIGEGVWNVDFHFSFRGKTHIYSGTAAGSLTEGILRGKVKNESKKRTFKFGGSFEDGVFTGTHMEIDGNDEQDTGTITLRGV